MLSQENVMNLFAFLWPYTESFHSSKELSDFLGDSLVKTLYFHCKGPGFYPWSGKFCMPHSAAKNNKTINSPQILFWYGFPGDSVVKNPPDGAGDSGSIPGSRRSPGGGNGNPVIFLPGQLPRTEEPGGPQSMGSKKSYDVTEHTYINCFYIVK